jgi:hypothetical protein
MNASRSGRRHGWGAVNIAAMVQHAVVIAGAGPAGLMLAAEPPAAAHV